MKSFRRFSLGYFVALAAMMLLSATAQAATVHNKAVIRAIRGSAQVSSNKGQTWQAAKVGAFLAANSVVKTDSESTVDLFLGENGPVVRVTPATQMGIDKLDLENTGIEKVIETQLDLKNGRILGSVKKMAAASKYEVKTPVGVAGIRGTEYSVDARGRVSIVTGSAVVVYIIDGVVLAPQPVGAGQTVTPPPNATTPPLVGPTTDQSFEGEMLQNITTEGGVITVVIQDGRRVVDEGNGNQFQDTGDGLIEDGRLAPSPDQTVQPNPNAIQGERDEVLSQSSPGSEL